MINISLREERLSSFKVKNGKLTRLISNKKTYVSKYQVPIIN